MRRFKGIGDLPSKAAASTTKMVRLMAGSVVLVWLMFFLGCGIFAFYGVIVGVTSLAIVDPVVAFILFVRGQLSFYYFATWGFGLPLIFGALGGFISLFIAAEENKSIGKMAGNITNLFRRIAGLPQTE